MPRLSLTDFVDVVRASGTPKANKIRSVKNREPYSVAFDYWKLLRDRLVEVHKKNLGKRALGTKIFSKLHTQKQDNYTEVVAGYKKWWGTKRINWFEPTHKLFTAHGVDVSVNPELGLEVNGEPYLVKLYFKSSKLTQYHIKVITYLMQVTLSKEHPDANMAILDTRRGKLKVLTKLESALGISLDSELAYIKNAWDLF